MLKPSEKIIFSCEEHRKCYETLFNIVKEGTQKPNHQMIGRLTEGVSSRILHKLCLNTPWKRELSSLINKEAYNWEEGGGEIAKKLSKSLQDALKSGSKIEPKIICEKAEVKAWYLRKANLRYFWQKELYALVIKEQKRWENFGGLDARTSLDFLKKMIKNGERPIKKDIAIGINKYQNFLSSNRLAYPWQIRLANAIDKADKKWQRKGGKELKVINKILDKYIKNQERPYLNTICTEAGYAATNIEKPNYPWQLDIKTKIKAADRKWQKEGGIDGIQCRTAFKQLVKEQVDITPRIVSKKAGFNSEFLSKNLFEWKLNLLNQIEEYTSKGLTEIHILYIDKDLLIQKIQTANHSLIYKRLGISVTNTKTKIVNYFTLSHIMYSSYNLNAKTNSKNRLFVNPDGYKDDRTIYIKGLLNACEGINHSILTSLIPRMILAALWMGDYIPKTIKEANNMFYHYSIHLHRLLKSGEKRHAVCSIEQKGMISLLAGMFLVNESEITKDYNSYIIPQKAPSSNAFSNMEQVTQEDFSYTFGFYFHLFDQIADFLLKGKDYPYKIQLPRGHAIIMGLAKHLIIPYHQMNKYGINCIDPTEGTILMDSELINLAKNNKVKYPNRYIKQKIKNLQKLEELNSDKFHEKRLQLGKKALDAWFICMLYLTSTNDSILGTYEWSDIDEYETEHLERKEFITIKPRAGNKPVRFTIPKSFMSSFKKFLLLRKFVLNDNKFKYLFFSAGFGKSASTTRSQFSGGNSSRIFNDTRNFLDDKLPFITSRNIRKDGGKDALNSHNMKIALSVLQNNKSTFINNYNGYTSKELGLQINNFLNSLHEHTISQQPILQEQQSSMGGCENDKNLIPKNFHEDSPINANCNDSKTCIFCKHFITFPEQEEIRKLLSLQYIIENIAYDKAEDESFYEEKMTPWINRIQAIFNEMIKKEPSIKQTITTTKIEVYNDGLLSPYWLDWIKDLDELERLA